MKKIVLILSSAISVFAGTAEQNLSDLTDKLFATSAFQKTTQLAVLPLENKVANEPQLGQAVSEMLVGLIQAKSQAQLVERMQLQHAMNELALSASGFVDENKALSLGKGVAAPVILVGSVSDLMGQRVVNVRLLETETGKVLSTASTTIGLSEQGEMKKAIFGEADQVSASLFRSAIIPGWGQFYTDHPVRGTISLVSFFGTIGYGVVSVLDANDKKKASDDFVRSSLTNSGKADILAEYCKTSTAACVNQNPIDQEGLNTYTTQKKDNLYKKYSDQVDLSNLVFMISGGVWALNMVDAYFAGAEQKRKVQLYFSALPSGSGMNTQLALTYGF
jgi:hypothetical protein